MLSSQQGLYRYLRHLTNRPDAAEDLAVPPPNENDSPEDELVREEIRRNLTECLDEMKTKYREALVLHYMEEKPYKEISDILRVPMGTVGTLIARGKNMLRAISQRKGGDLSP